MNFSEKTALLRSFFGKLPEADKQLAFDAIDEYIFFLKKIESLSDLPIIVFSKSDKSMQKATPAAKLLKEYSQVLDAKRSTLIKLLKLNEIEEDDPLIQALKNFK